MRLMESKEYKGRRIRVYLLLPDEAAGSAPRPVLGVQVRGHSAHEHSASEHSAHEWTVLPGVLHLDEALRWGRNLIDRAAGPAQGASQQIKV